MQSRFMGKDPKSFSSISHVKMILNILQMIHRMDAEDGNFIKKSKNGELRSVCVVGHATIVNYTGKRAIAVYTQNT